MQIFIETRNFLNSNQNNRQMKKIIISVLLIFSTMSHLFSQEEIKLYPDGAPESNGLEGKESMRDTEFIVDISEPRMIAFPAAKDNNCGTAVLICPGGAYVGVSQIKEGSEIAEWFNSIGVSAFVLYYRMPNGNPEIPLKDARTALAIIHKRAAEWQINKKKIGIMGFSAGGHLAATVATHFKEKKQHPAFMILGYPVITMSSYTHGGSRSNLLGKNPDIKLVELYSNELQVTRRTPPAFIVHAIDDRAVPIANSRNFVVALKRHDIPCRLQEYEQGGHGFGMRKSGIPADDWDKALKNWLQEMELIK
jgi:acetyl esterase/lipase